MDSAPRCGGTLPQHAGLGPLSPVWERARERGCPRLSPSPVSSHCLFQGRHTADTSLGLTQRRQNLLPLAMTGLNPPRHIPHRAVERQVEAWCLVSLLLSAGVTID
jgi:hypothetical protein